jgi:hypothetical protein
MSSTTQLSRSALAPLIPTHALSTEVLAGGGPQAGIQAVTLLDDRVRRRAVQAGLAPPGRYLALAGGEETLVVALEDGATRIGRGLGANLRLDDARVSRRHAIVLRRNGRVRLLDDRSSNGTFVNDRQVTEVELHGGDVIRVGPVELRYLELSAKHIHPRQGTPGAGPRASESRSQRAFEGWLASRMRTRARERRTGIASGTRPQPSRAAA